MLSLRTVVCQKTGRATRTTRKTITARPELPRINRQNPGRITSRVNRGVGADDGVVGNLADEAWED